MGRINRLGLWWNSNSKTLTKEEKIQFKTHVKEIKNSHLCGCGQFPFIRTLTILILDMLMQPAAN